MIVFEIMHPGQKEACPVPQTGKTAKSLNIPEYSCYRLKWRLRAITAPANPMAIRLIDEGSGTAATLNVWAEPLKAAGPV
jgi:hypothetical protein